jgi:hypothetical protein
MPLTEATKALVQPAAIRTVNKIGRLKQAWEKVSAQLLILLNPVSGLIPSLCTPKVTLLTTTMLLKVCFTNKAMEKFLLLKTLTDKKEWLHVLIFVHCIGESVVRQFYWSSSWQASNTSTLSRF